VLELQKVKTRLLLHALSIAIEEMNRAPDNGYQHGGQRNVVSMPEIGYAIHERQRTLSEFEALRDGLSKSVQS